MRGLIIVSPVFYKTAYLIGKAFLPSETCFLVPANLSRKFMKEFNVDEKKVIIDAQSQILKNITNGQISSKFANKDEELITDDFLNKLLIADRRIGNGFVSGGLSRPDKLNDHILRERGNFIPGLFPWLLEEYDKIFLNEFDYIFFYTISSGPHLLLSELAKKRGVPPVNLVHSRIGNFQFFDFGNDGLFSFKSKLNKNRTERKNDVPFATLSKPSYSKYLNISFSTETIAILRRPLAMIYHIFKKPFGEKNESIRRDFFYMLVSLRRLFFLLKAKKPFIFDRSYKYFYFPLHVDPESSTMVLSPLITDQAWMIEQLAKNLPRNGKLIVKDHLPMVGRRQKSFLKRIKRMPRVEIVDARISSDYLILNSDVTVSITGSATFEAICKGKSSIILSRTPFSNGYPLIWDGNIYSLSKLMRDAVSFNPTPDFMENYLRRVEQYAVEINDDTIWGKWSSVNSSSLEDEISKYKHGIEVSIKLFRRSQVID